MLLQTSRADCFNIENAKRHINFRIAFHSGSQRSYIKAHSCKQLDLKPVGSLSLELLCLEIIREEYSLER